MSEIFDPTSQEPAVESSRKTIFRVWHTSKRTAISTGKARTGKDVLDHSRRIDPDQFSSRLLHLAYGGRVQAAPLDRRLDAGNDELDPGARSEDRRSD